MEERKSKSMSLAHISWVSFCLDFEWRFTATCDCRLPGLVQIYIRDEESCLFRPEKELKAFAKVELEPGETKTVSLELDEATFSYYVPHLGRFAVESGRFDVLAGASSQDIYLEDTVVFLSEDEVRLPLDMTDSFRDFLSDDRYAEYARQLLEILQIGEGHMFYQMFMGVNLIQMQELMAIMGIDGETGRQMAENLVKRCDLIKKG